MIIETQALAVGYKDTLLSDVSIQANQPALVALTGRNGCGKSTLLKTLCGLIPPIEGQVKINNQPLQNLGLTERAHMVTMNSLSMDRHVLLNVRDYISLGRVPYSDLFGRLTSSDEDIIETYTRLLDVERLSKKALNKISEGEFQRVQLAKCLVQETPMLLLDEPTAFMDMQQKENTFALLKEISKTKNKLIILATHDIPFAQEHLDATWSIENGLIHC